MPNVTIRKSEKMEALGNMINAKFLDEYKALMKRRQDLALTVYDETKGKMGWALKDAAGSHWNEWLETGDRQDFIGVKAPTLLVETGRKSYGAPIMKDFFTGEDDNRIWRFYRITLTKTIVEPASQYDLKGKLLPDQATKPTQKKVATLVKNIKAFEEKVSDFYWNAYRILMSIRTSRQVDDKFPELWQYLPTGTRETIKQALVVPQEQIDKLREELKS